VIVRTLTIAALAAALALSACPAEPTGPWDIIANGTQFNGIALAEQTLNPRAERVSGQSAPSCQPDHSSSMSSCYA
jgi:hypothetical protein